MRGRILLAARLLGGLALLAACGGEEPASRNAPPPEPAAPASQTPQAPTAALCDAESLRGDAQAGALVYQQFCATCHGPKGRGDGPAAAASNPKPADHGDPAYMGSLSDRHLCVVITRGGAAVGKSPLMAAWGGVLNDEQVRDVIAFVRQLSAT